MRIEKLVTDTARIGLGTIPSSEELNYVLGLPSVGSTSHFLGWSPGTFFAAQAEVTMASQRVRRTNSIPVVVRCTIAVSAPTAACAPAQP